MSTPLAVAVPHVGATLNGTSHPHPLIPIYQHIGRVHKDGQRTDFVDALVALGMQDGYGDRMYGLLEPPSGADYRRSRKNTEMSAALGVMLKDGMYARNQLFYDVFQRYHNLDTVDQPEMLVVEARGVRHIGGVQGRRNPEARHLIFKHAPVSDIHPRTGKPCHASPMKIFKVLLGEKPIYHESDLLRRKRHLKHVLGEQLGDQFIQLLTDQRILIPPPAIADMLAQSMKRALAGEPVVFVGAFCPDYSYEETGNPLLPYRYTFTGVGEGVGLVAQQFARVIDPISRFFTKLGIRHSFVLGIGDFEADSADVLRRVGCDYAEFVRRCAKSLEAFRASVDPSIPLTLELCDAHRCKGRLRPLAGEATARMLRGDFGLIGQVYGDPHKLSRDIAEENRTFYRRWYGPDLSDYEILKRVLAQAGEYSALADIYNTDLKGSVVIALSGDRPRMHAYDFLNPNPTPVLCVERAY